MAILYRSREIKGRWYFECPLIYREAMLRISEVNENAPIPVEPGDKIFSGRGSRVGVIRYDRVELKEMVNYWILKG